MATQLQLAEDDHNQFKMISQIGSGSFGKCFLCERLNDGAHVVLKKAPIGTHSKNEARLLSQFLHENVVRILESYLSSRSIYIVLEYLSGGDLHEHIRRNEGTPFKDKTVLQYTVQIASALVHIHGLRVVHRDIKPRNILLSPDLKVVKVCDFGIAIQLDEGKKAKGSIGEAGTINYMAPEILEGRDYDFKCDVWSLGCVLYELVERKKAFPGTQNLAVFHKICSGILALPESSKLMGLITELLTATETKRPSAQDVLDSIEQNNGGGGRRLTFWRHITK